jgi:hypothetical protein
MNKDYQGTSCEELIFFLKDINEFDNSTEGEFEFRNLYMIQSGGAFTVPARYPPTPSPSPLGLTKFICTAGTCKKTFKSKLRYERHMDNHLCEKKFICEFDNCGKVYKSKENLSLHYKNKHLHMKPYVCKYCPQAFSHRNGKIYHERKSHRDQMIYACGVGSKLIMLTLDCKDSFPTLSTLNYHIKKYHTNNEGMMFLS